MSAAWVPNLLSMHEIRVGLLGSRKCAAIDTENREQGHVYLLILSLGIIGESPVSAASEGVEGTRAVPF